MEINDMIFYSGLFEIHSEAKHAPDAKKVDPAEQVQKALQLHSYRADIS